MMTYPVSVTVEPRLTGHNKLTTALRPVLAIPHALLVGPVYWSSRTGGAGLLGAAAYLMAIVSWFTLLITGEHIRGIREFSLYYLRWHTRNLAYMGLFADAYPSFGDGAYPATIDVISPSVPRDRTSIAIRLLLAIPHVILLVFLTFGWILTTLVAWFAILFTGAYPPSLYPFGLAVMRWTLRVEAYLLLLVDEYPPFTLE
ncbi:MAG: DUF4389 domain-containing protein [Acidobacteria bacterium]|nr:DUF4389 domain-containing protein [Acidobacteriota bacterium]